MPDNDPFMPNQASNKETAKGSRETIPADEPDAVADPEQRLVEEDLEQQRRRNEGAGITNRPLPEEIAEQEQLPERNTRKRGAGGG